VSKPVALMSIKILFSCWCPVHIRGFAHTCNVCHCAELYVKGNNDFDATH